MIIIKKENAEESPEASKEERKSEVSPGCEIRLYQRAVFMGFRRGQRRQYENQALVKIEGLNDRKDVPYYLGKRVAYVYKGKTEKNGGRLRTIWGRVIGNHGARGTVRAKFHHNLPGSAIGSRLRVMLFPQHD